MSVPSQSENRFFFSCHLLRSVFRPNATSSGPVSRNQTRSAVQTGRKEPKYSNKIAYVNEEISFSFLSTPEGAFSFNFKSEWLMHSSKHGIKWDLLDTGNSCELLITSRTTALYLWSCCYQWAAIPSVRYWDLMRTMINSPRHRTDNHHLDMVAWRLDQS